MDDHTTSVERALHRVEPSIIGGDMKLNGISHCRYLVALGLVAMLAGCGGGGGGSQTAQCTANCTPVSVTNSDGTPVSNSIVTAIDPNNGQICATSSSYTSNSGSTQISLTNCGGTTAIVTAPVSGGGTTVAGVCTVGQSCNLSPGTTTSTAPYAGTWTAKYSSSVTTGDYGTCTVVLNANGVIVDQNGNAVTSTSSPNCFSNVSPSNDFALWGTLSADGTFNGSTSAGATYTGAFGVGTTTYAGGGWKNSGANTSGTWSATRTTPAP